MFAIGRARRVLALVVLRLSLPLRLAREPLDALLASLTTAPALLPANPRDAASLTRDVLNAEFAVGQLPWVARTCLYRALARYAVLRRGGLAATFVMGLGPRGIEDDGHAWVEVDGEAFEELDDVRHFCVTFRYPTVSDVAPRPLP